jgi:hypothetical protein
MKLIALALLFAATLDASPQQRFSVTPQQVARALLRHGLSVADEQVSLVAGIVASTAEPELDVDAMQPLTAVVDNPRIQYKVRLDCPQPRTCVPFFAIVSWPPGTPLSELPTLDRGAQARPTAPPIAIRAGSPATLLVDTAQMHLRIPVISLQNGALGSTIHVASPDRKQTYTATVLSPTTLTGSI